jgi:hypothetical protein
LALRKYPRARTTTAATIGILRRMASSAVVSVGALSATADGRFLKRVGALSSAFTARSTARRDKMPEAELLKGEPTL